MVWGRRGLVVALAACVCAASPRPGRRSRSRRSWPCSRARTPTSALPQTQITFRGIPASQIGHITVVGSSTGAHTGTIEADSDGQGGSFIPSTPFTAGETVTVTTGLNVTGGTNGSFQFGIATPFGTINPMKLPMVPAGSNGVQHFHSRPDLLAGVDHGQPAIVRCSTAATSS